MIASYDEIRERVDARLADLRGSLEADHEAGRRALRTLVGDDRLAVSADPERGFRIDGFLHLALNVETARRPEASERFTRMVAGEGFEPPTSGL